MTREEVIKEYRVREILTAARKVVGRHGFEGTTIDRVAEEAKVAKGTIYLYFSNKDDLLHAAIVEGLRTMIAEIKRPAEFPADPAERVPALIRRMFSVGEANLDFIKAFLLDSSFVRIEPADARGEEVRQLYVTLLDFTAEVISSAARAGVIKAVDPQFCAFMLNEMVTATFQRRLFGFTSSPPETDAEPLIDLFLHGVACAPSRNGNGQ
ncbi:MAG TPA: TetR/AcrR family transcriptional regulator [Candidatus Binataceae bacterium]|nr:TetR/AcrR family transcriptional regulator [Candidatus Binataceae bacterium]